MTRYQLAKIIQWAGTLQSRKRMQKVVYLLQLAGCPLCCEYRLHHFGPYSADVARVTDQLTDSKLLDEIEVRNGVGRQYDYHLAEEAVRRMDAFEQTANGRQELAPLAAFEELAKSLLRADAKELEVAATIAYFRQKEPNWEAAVEKACQFKGVPPGSALAVEAQRLAQRIVK